MPDIKCINGKYYDFGTHNKSFLLTAMELKTLGIKNYYFMLRVDNPRTAGIDPFKPNITQQEMMTLMQEYRTNIWSFARDAVKISVPAGNIHFELHRGLAAGMWCYEHSQNFCLTEPRQTYKTTGLIATAILWAYQFQRSLDIHFFGKDSPNTKKNIATLKEDIALLPDWLQLRKYVNKEGKIKKARESTEILRNDLTKNKVTIHPVANSIDKAESMGRGTSTSTVYMDEIEHTPYFPVILANMGPAVETASNNAKAAGFPSAIIMTSTPKSLYWVR